MQESFWDKFKEYLSKKMKSDRAEQIIWRSSKKQKQSSVQILKLPTQILSNTQNSSTSFSRSQLRVSSVKLQEENHHQSLKKKRLKKTKDIQENVCSICLESFCDRVETSCSHSFCHKCLIEWLKNSSRCPYCRSSCQYYVQKGERVKIQQKQFEFEQQILIEGDDALDYQCYLCEKTNQGDEVLICDKCSIYACHIECDPRLTSQILEDDDQWFCHFCI